LSCGQLWTTLPHSALDSYARRAARGAPIAVPRDQNDRAKALGALWDKARSTWVAPEGVNPKPFIDAGWLRKSVIYGRHLRHSA